MSILIYFATIFWSLFPNLIHVFQGGEGFINKVNETNLVSNSDLTLAKPSPNQNEPLGFTYRDVTDITLSNGIANFTATAYRARMYRNDLDINVGETVYYFARIKTSDNNTKFYGGNSYSPVPNTNTFEFISAVKTASTSTNIKLIGVYDDSSSNFTPIEVDYIGAFNVSQMMLNGVKDDNGILFTDLTNVQIRTQLDIWITEYVDLSFNITKDNTSDKWFNTGFVDKTAERDFLDYLGYFVWLFTPPIILFAILDLLRRVI